MINVSPPPLCSRGHVISLTPGNGTGSDESHSPHFWGLRKTALFGGDVHDLSVRTSVTQRVLARYVLPPPFALIPRSLKNLKAHKRANLLQHACTTAIVFLLRRGILGWGPTLRSRFSHRCGCERPNLYVAPTANSVSTSDLPEWTVGFLCSFPGEIGWRTSGESLAGDLSRLLLLGKYRQKHFYRQKLHRKLSTIKLQATR